MLMKCQEVSPLQSRCHLLGKSWSPDVTGRSRMCLVEGARVTAAASTEEAGACLLP